MMRGAQRRHQARAQAEAARERRAQALREGAPLASEGAAEGAWQV